MIIAQISDTHLALDAPEGGRRITDFERVIDDINALDPQPDVIVHTGDIVHNGRADEYAAAAAILSRARAPVHVLAGNKDNRANLLAAFASPDGMLKPDSPFIDYAVEDLALRLLVLDTVNPNSRKGEFCDERFARLEAMIAAAPDKPMAVFCHHPPIEVLVGPEPFHYDDPGTMEALRAALARTGKVVHVFSGHVHRPFAGAIGAIPVTVATCVATALRWGDYPEAMKTMPLYAIHRFDPATGFSSETRVAGPWPAVRRSDDAAQ